MDNTHPNPPIRSLVMLAIAIVIAATLSMCLGCNGRADATVTPPADVAAAICLVDGILAQQESKPQPDPQPEPGKTCPKCRGAGTDGRVACGRCGGSGTITEFADPRDEPETIDDRDPWIDYSEFLQQIKTRQGDGDWYMLVTADTCPPCQVLKAKIRGMADLPRIVMVDQDSHPRAARYFLADRTTIPQLVRINTSDGRPGAARVYWDRQTTLDDFLR